MTEDDINVYITKMKKKPNFKYLWRSEIFAEE
jgi:hypothetical protein